MMLFSHAIGVSEGLAVREGGLCQMLFAHAIGVSEGLAVTEGGL
jgi:hypothetical protein